MAQRKTSPSWGPGIEHTFGPGSSINSFILDHLQRGAEAAYPKYIFVAALIALPGAGGSGGGGNTSFQTYPNPIPISIFVILAIGPNDSVGWDRG